MTLSFGTLLIANRGEIARRIIRTAHSMGLRTVAVYSDADAEAAHVREADHAVHLGSSNPTHSYLSGEKVIAAALSAGAQAIAPGYGFLSENADFAVAVEAAGLKFVGPTPEQLDIFGNKDSARQAAARAGIPMLAGTAVLADADAARAAAAELGYPVMVKAVGGGGGIGLQVCATPTELDDAFDRVHRLAGSHFGATGVYLERYVTRARHVEVQVFGDGRGTVITLGTRDCSLQRRNQKVIEEAPAPALDAALQSRLLHDAQALATSVDYRSAGTVEFIVDADTGEAAFLEMNTRLQVEHPVTEQVTGIDLVEWMLRVAGDDADFLTPWRNDPPKIVGHAIEARIYAEDPAEDYRPSPGIVTAVRFPDAVRVDSGIESGSQVSSFYDPLLAKVIATDSDRAGALSRLAAALDDTEIYGLTTNLAQLRQAVRLPDLAMATHTTASLGGVTATLDRVDVIRPGTSTTIQDLPGRVGLWNVGIPPSGPMDPYSYAAANQLLGNTSGAAALECTLHGPRLRFADATRIAVTGAPTPITLNGESVDMWQVIDVPAAGVVDVGTPVDSGLRTYLAVAGGFSAPEYLGSRATFALGGFGGPFGRDLAVGDVLKRADPSEPTPADTTAGHRSPRRATVPAGVSPIPVTHEWHLAVTPGPQAGADYFTPDDLTQIYGHLWRVGRHANRTGIRLEGPCPQWSRADGGEAGLHPSNLHDNPYSIGALNISGDTPILLGPDGPSLGGFVCPVTVIVADRWKLGQLRPGDTVRFVPVADEDATRLRSSITASPLIYADTHPDDGALARIERTAEQPGVSYQRAGDDNILIEYGTQTLDLDLRMRVHALSGAIEESGLEGIIDATPGVRSLHLHFDPDRLDQRALVESLIELEQSLGATRDLVVPSRHVRLPLCFDDPSITQALDRYRTGVRADAPWLPSNIEFIRRINGLDSVDQVAEIIFAAEYLVLGLGDVYLGAPLAVPLDPRHRLVTTKYNPARTWTPADAVGIGGKYLCVYGMDSPGGYQLIGRTLPIWSTHQHQRFFEAGKPWLFRYFDRISWEPVSAAELAEIRAEARAGRYCPSITEGSFAFADHLDFLAANAVDIAAVEERRQEAFALERAAWHCDGEFDKRIPAPHADEPADLLDIPSGATIVTAPMTGSVWRVEAVVGATVECGDTIAVLEAMKLELPVQTSHAGRILQVLVEPGTQVGNGTPIAVIGAA